MAGSERKPAISQRYRQDSHALMVSSAERFYAWQLSIFHIYAEY